MFKKLCIAVCFSMLLSACTPISFEVEKLMRPPKLSDEQNEVFGALTSALGNDNVRLKYPRDGEYLSAFTFYDIDGDQVDEAMVFYEDLSQNNCRVNILDKSSGKWVSKRDFAGLGTDIDSVMFKNISSKEGVDIVIGWISGAYNIASVYRYSENNIEDMFTGNYDKMNISDFNGDKLDDMILLTQNSDSATVHAQLVKPGIMKLEIVSDIKLTLPMTAIQKVTAGYISKGVKGIVIDGSTADKQYVSEMIAVENDTLVLPLKDVDGLFSMTRRYQNIFSRDINKDKILDLPSQVLMPGYSESRITDPLYITTYRSMTDEGLSSIEQAFVNTSSSSGGYAIILPDHWYDKVSAVRQTETGEIIFFKFNKNLSEQSVELLRIRVYSQKDYHDKFETKDTYKLIASKGMFSYYAYIVEKNDPLSITEQQLKEMFRLI